MDVSGTAVALLPAGVLLDFAGSSAPTGFLMCDGSLVSRTTYARLFESVGTTWGAGDGSTTFKLPDFRGRVAVGSGTGSGLTARSLAATGGAETHQLSSAEMPSHTHIQNSHNHTQDPHTHNGGNGAGSNYSPTLGGSNNAINIAMTPSVTATNQATTATNNNTGGDGYHNNMQPFVVVSKIIKF